METNTTFHRWGETLKQMFRNYTKEDHFSRSMAAAPSVMNRYRNQSRSRKGQQQQYDVHVLDHDWGEHSPGGQQLEGSMPCSERRCLGHFQSESAEQSDVPLFATEHERLQQALQVPVDHWGIVWPCCVTSRMTMVSSGINTSSRLTARQQSTFFRSSSTPTRLCIPCPCRTTCP